MKNLLAATLVEKRIGDAPFLFEGDLVHSVSTAHEFGYTGVELHITDPQSLPRKALHTVLEETGLHISALGTGRVYVNEGISLTDPDLNIQKKAVERLKSFIDCAREFNCMVIVGCMRGNISDASELPDALDRLRDSMRILDAYANQQGVIMVFEPINRYENNFLCTVSEIAEFITAHSLTNTRILIDTFHMNIEEKDICETIRQYHNYIHYVHIADSNRLYPGGGHTDIQHILSTLFSLDYPGPLSAECLPLPTDNEAADNWIKTVKEYIINYEAIQCRN